jgi:hypothetical protein
MFWKRLVTFGVVLSLSLSVAVGIVVATPGEASAQEFQNASEFCKFLAEERPEDFEDAFDSHADCVTHFRSARRTVEFCEFLEETQPELYESLFANRGRCIDFFRSKFP